jgi:hypothetical protein
VRPPFRYVGAEPSADTIAVLTDLLAAAKAGELIGVAFAAMYRKREYVVGYTGECARNPTFTRGMVAALNDDLGGRSA